MNLGSDGGIELSKMDLRYICKVELTGLGNFESKRTELRLS